LKAALDDGMELLEIPHDDYREVVESLYAPTADSRVGDHQGDLILAQGGADLGAKEGIALLAEEIKCWQLESDIESLTVVTPSGTGTTAYFLAKSLPDMTIMTTPLIGTTEYLEEQMQYLGALPDNLTIIETDRQYRFGKSYPEYLIPYQMFLDQGIEMDLLYAPKMLIALSEVMTKVDGEILYVHSGGIKGNSSMLERYRHKGMC
jgi:1-aminocyclopropane-1-carboxylate deaminase